MPSLFHFVVAFALFVVASAEVTTFHIPKNTKGSQTVSLVGVNCDAVSHSLYG
jgi:hypothetical protein